MRKRTECISLLNVWIAVQYSTFWPRSYLKYTNQEHKCNFLNQCEAGTTDTSFSLCTNKHWKCACWKQSREHVPHTHRQETILVGKKLATPPPGGGKIWSQNTQKPLETVFFGPFWRLSPNFPKKTSKKISNNFGRFAPKKNFIPAQVCQTSPNFIFADRLGGPQPSWKLRAGKMVLAGGTPPPQAPRGKIPLA